MWLMIASIAADWNSKKAVTVIGDIFKWFNRFFMVNVKPNNRDFTAHR